MSKIANKLSNIAFNTESNLFHSGHNVCKAEWHAKMHSHEFNELILVIQGQQKTITDEGKVFFINPGEVIFYPRQTGHKESKTLSTPLEIMFLAFTGDFGGEYTKVHDTSTQLRNLVKNILRLNSLNLPDINLIRQAYLIAILTEFDLLTQMDSPHKLVIQTRDYIYKNLTKKIRLSDLAKFAGMSKFHFIHKYKSLTKLTPMEDVRRMRLEEALGLISTSHFCLKEIAHMTGFSNEYMFSKNFKKHFGSPPGTYRKKSLPKIDII